MDFPQIVAHTEALIFASDKPVSLPELTDLINTALGLEEKATAELMQNAIDTIAEKYDSDFYPFGLKESGSGYQFLTKATYYKTVALLNGDKYLKKLSTAALETLAIIAYRQPVTKGEMEHIRGVNCDYAVQKLLEKELVVITGRRENMPGQPLEYATSRTFMDYFGLNSTDELPKLNDLFPQATEATPVTESNPVEQDLTPDETTVDALPTHMEINEKGDVVEVPDENRPPE
jgi:segregation and condensation protein B